MVIMEMISSTRKNKKVYIHFTQKYQQSCAEFNFVPKNDMRVLKSTISQQKYMGYQNNETVIRLHSIINVYIVQRHKETSPKPKEFFKLETKDLKSQKKQIFLFYSLYHAASKKGPQVTKGKKIDK